MNKKESMIQLIIMSTIGHKLSKEELEQLSYRLYSDQKVETMRFAHFVQRMSKTGITIEDLYKEFIKQF